MSSSSTYPTKIHILECVDKFSKKTIVEKYYFKEDAEQDLSELKVLNPDKEYHIRETVIHE